jgi:hypothetical protein
MTSPVFANVLASVERNIIGYVFAGSYPHCRIFNAVHPTFSALKAVENWLNNIAIYHLGQVNRLKTYNKPT